MVQRDGFILSLVFPSAGLLNLFAYKQLFSHMERENGIVDVGVHVDKYTAHSLKGFHYHEPKTLCSHKNRLNFSL